MSLRLEIVTPAGVAYSSDADTVTLPSVSGTIGIRPRHVPMLTRIIPGEIAIHFGDSDDLVAVGEGVVSITGDRVSIVTDMAIASKDIDEATVEEARQRALARLQDKISDEEVATVNASLARSLAQLKVKRRRR